MLGLLARRRATIVVSHGTSSFLLPLSVHLYCTDPLLLLLTSFLMELSRLIAKMLCVVVLCFVIEISSSGRAGGRPGSCCCDATRVPYYYQIAADIAAWC